MVAGSGLLAVAADGPPAGADPGCVASRHCVQVLVTTDDLQQWTYTHIDAGYVIRTIPVPPPTPGHPQMETGQDELVRGGISLLDVLRLGAPQLTSQSVTAVTISNSDGRSTTVSGSDLRESADPDTDPYDNGLVPVIYSSAGDRSGGAAEYLRPLYAGTFDGTDPDDTNAGDAILNRYGQAMIVQFHTGSTKTLTPTLSASPNPAKVNAPVTFTVSGGCEQANPDNSVVVHYGDGGNGSTTHRYKTAKTYDASADVYCADGSSGGTPSISVVVDGAHPTTAPARSTAASNETGGGGPQANGAPTTESQPPDRVGLESTTSQPASGPAGTGGAGGSAGPTAATGQATTRGGTSSTSASATVSTRGTPGAGNGRVVGYLLGRAAGGVIVTAAPPPRPAAAPSTVARAAHGHLVVAVLAGLAVLVLLGFGAGAEWRRPSRTGRRS